ncbi:hypothetical protein A2893_02695 [Candidatus Woesebacteria bacterium RIFCSPLOWO2_01_FULL_39_25]|uniref:DUF4935 domain-containing protein n=1 Tax=Candidatus Woesebacteria bacterium RIFCSPLOWO2_01_FULL_39_25 TaxID=1802521 RepID=A0A1F8BK00_9BACT|nr:MAG: hypothetical protein A2893_02695 [Candidatus Woesebacteria bacterium RIFCSPLOWO2_01_FULL_39_25]
MTNKDFPKCIYLDTNILRKIGISNYGPAFLELKEWSKNVKAPIAMPESVWMEWLHDFSESVDKKALQTTNNLRDIEIILELKQKQFKLPENYIDILIKSIKKKIKLMGIEVIETPKNISIRQLVTMAAFKIRPFEDKREKGFRDTVILYTILEDAKKRNIKDCLFITEDKIFAHEDVQQIIKKYRVNIDIADSLETATVLIKSVLDEKIKIFMELKKQKLLNFIKSKQTEIFQYIKDNAELTEDFITKGGLLSKKQEIFGQIENIIEFEPLEIESAFEAAKSPTEEPPPKNSEYILISIKTRLKVEYLPFLLFNRPTVKVQDLSKYKEIMRTSTPRYYGEPTIIELERDPTVTALVTKNDKGEYIDLRLDRVNTMF